MDEKYLIEEAKKASKNSRCQYSSFCVGAALITNDGKVYYGCNIENHGIQSICAERCAFCNALSSGESFFKAIAIAGKAQDSDEFIKTLPCGYCRQFMSEYVNTDFIVICEDDNGNILKYTINELLPHSFDL